MSKKFKVIYYTNVVKGDKVPVYEQEPIIDGEPQTEPITYLNKKSVLILKPHFVQLPTKKKPSFWGYNLYSHNLGRKDKLLATLDSEKEADRYIDDLNLESSYVDNFKETYSINNDPWFI